MLLPLLLPQHDSRAAGRQGSVARRAPRIVVIRESMYSASVSFSVSSAVFSPCVSMILALVSVARHAGCVVSGERSQGSVRHQLPPIVRCNTSTWAMSAARSSLDDALAEAVIAVEAGYLRKTTENSALACRSRVAGAGGQTGFPDLDNREIG